MKQSRTLQILVFGLFLVALAVGTAGCYGESETEDAATEEEAAATGEVMEEADAAMEEEALEEEEPPAEEAEEDPGSEG